MSSEYSIHLGDKPIKGEVFTLNPELLSTVVRVKVDDEHKFVLYVKDDRLLEASLLFHKIAQDLAALLPDVDACCRCVPGTPDDQCAEHGYGAHKIKQAGTPDASDDPARCSGCGGLLIHNTDCPDTIPIEEAAEHDDCPHSEMGFTTPCDNSCPCFQDGYEAERRP